MKTVMLTGLKQMRIMDVPVPKIITSTDVLVKMKIVGVCGSDVHYYKNGRIGSQVIKYPFPVGHEGAGIVERIGNKVTLVKPGDRIAIDPSMPCFECDQCKSGRHNTCRKLKFLGCPGQAEGCLAEYIVIPETSCLPISKNISFEEAAISEPLAIGVYSIKQSIPMMKAKVGILGFGPIGMSIMLPALAQGAEKIYVTDKINDRLDKAKQTGAHLTGNPDKENIVKKLLKNIPEGLDVVFECCGQQEALDNALDIIKPGGKIMIVGIPEFDNWSIRADLIRRKEITVINVRRQNHCTDTAIELIAKRKIDISKFPTHRFNFEDTQKAFDLVSEYRDGVMKAMIEFN